MQEIAQSSAEIQDVPPDLHQGLIDLTQKYGPEMMTAVLGFLSIYLINKGSSRYGDLSADLTEEDTHAIVHDASRDVGLGAVGMAATAFAAGNPLFAYPEVIAVIGALKPYFETLSPMLKNASKKLRLDAIVKAAAVVVGTTTASLYASSPMETLPPISLGALTVAFSGNVKQEVYRLLTLSGGTGLIVGSAAAGVNAMQENNAVGAIMSGAFFALNVLFTRNEWNEAQKIGGMRRLVQETVRSIMSVLGRKKPMDLEP
jgi:hypothetical protein